MGRFFKREAAARSARPKSGRVRLTYYSSHNRNTAASPFDISTAKPKKISWRSRTIDWLLIILLISGIGYSLIVRPTPKLSLSSTIYHPQKVYLDTVSSKLQALKNRNKLTLDQKEIITSLQKQFPEIIGGSVNLPLFSQIPQVTLNIAKPSLLLKGTPGTFGANDRLVIDQKGSVVGLITDLPQFKDLPLVTDNSGFSARKGQQALSTADVNFILDIVAQAKHAGVPIAGLVLPPKGQEVDLITGDRPYFVKFYLGGDSAFQIGQFLAARNQFDKGGSQPSQYLDVRVNGKIFYK